MNESCGLFALFWFVAVGLMSIVGGATIGYVFGYEHMRRVSVRALIKQRDAIAQKGGEA